jgi:hypothetical protein
MKQPNLAEKIIIVSIEGIYMGISSAIRTFIDLMLRLLFGTSAFADCGLSTNVSLPLVEAADVDNNKLVDPEVTSESNVTILLSNGKAGFTEAKGSPLFRGLLPNDISIMCRYWYANKFDCIIVL